MINHPTLFPHQIVQIKHISEPSIYRYLCLLFPGGADSGFEKALSWEQRGWETNEWRLLWGEYAYHWFRLKLIPFSWDCKSGTLDPYAWHFFSEGAHYAQSFLRVIYFQTFRRVGPLFLMTIKHAFYCISSIFSLYSIFSQHFLRSWASSQRS